jgi:curved DNA-binding protein CbpA
MNDARFREVLGVEPGASREEIRRCWRRRVMENHPDRFPSDRKTLQELRIIALNEAYASLMAGAREADLAARACPQDAVGTRATRGASEPHPTGRATSAVGLHRDPAYAYYKQGFLNFSLAVHGIAELDARVVAGRRASDTHHYEAAEDFAGSLGLLAEAHRYFARVVERHPGSVWAPDATMKLRRIERFTRLYRTILSNLVTTVE